ncbi:MAG: DUF2085 domain-containing protein [bacterium]|nr:DUF2085 domain-containing protein [bacterium]
MFETIFDILSYLCHQLPDRTLFISTVPLPICARCAGVYTGMAISALYLIVNRRRLFVTPTVAAWLLALAAILLSVSEYVFTWFLHLTDGFPNFTRYAVSLFSGAGVMITVLGIITLIQFPADERDKRFRPFGVIDVAIIAVSCSLAIFLPLFGSGVVWWALLVLYGLGALGYFGGLNYIPFAVGFRLLKYRPGWKVYLLVGLALAVMQFIEYMLLRSFYEQYSVIYGAVHRLLEM